MIALLAKLPVSGDRLLEIILDGWKEPVGLADEGGPTFWLVVADQFERRGIACSTAIERGLTAINTGADLRDLGARGADPGDLRKRAKILSELAARFGSPRPARPKPKSPKLPPLVVAVGEVYRFPTMDGKAFNPYLPSWETTSFAPDGWGALLVLANGRVYDWFPWCAAVGLTVDASRPPSLEDARRARFIAGDQRGSYLHPRRTHIKKIGLELLGCLKLDPIKVAAAMPRDASPQYAVMCDWTFVPEARSWRGTPGDGMKVLDLVAS